MINWQHCLTCEYFFHLPPFVSWQAVQHEFVLVNFWLVYCLNIWLKFVFSQGVIWGCWWLSGAGFNASPRQRQRDDTRTWGCPSSWGWSSGLPPHFAELWDISNEVPSAEPGSGWFHAAKNEEELDKLTHYQFTNNTEKKIKWVIGLFCQWREHIMASVDCDPRICRSDLHFPKHLVLEDVVFCLHKFLTEVWKLNGSEYLPHTLYQMVVSIQIYLKSHKIYWKLLGKGCDNLNDLYYTLENLMKQRTAQGLGQKVSAKVASQSDEDKMWEEGVLGETHPLQLCDTILFLLGMNLALHGGEEHKKLQRPGFNPQITVGFDSDGHKYLIFQEDQRTKTNQGGLDRHKQAPRRMYVYENPHRECCPVRLYEKYCSLLPKGGMKCDLYLHPIAKPLQNQWYCECPIGINTLRMTVKRLTESVRLDSKFTNHSLRATSATHMYTAGIPEKLIKEITGHCSDCVHEYECTPDMLKRSVSATLASGQNFQESIPKKVKYSSEPSTTNNSIAECLNAANVGAIVSQL